MFCRALMVLEMKVLVPRASWSSTERTRQSNLALTVVASSTGVYTILSRKSRNCDHHLHLGGLVRPSSVSCPLHLAGHCGAHFHFRPESATAAGAFLKEVWAPTASKTRLCVYSARGEDLQALFRSIFRSGSDENPRVEQPGARTPRLFSNPKLEAPSVDPDPC